MSFAQNVTQLAPSCSDHELIAGVRSGSDWAFEELYSRYRARIRSYTLGMLSDHGRAEEITQDVFVSALRRLRDTDRPIDFKPWIYEIARNACIDEFRRRRRAGEISLESSGGAEETSTRWPRSASDPAAAIENKQKLDDLRGAFHVLSETHHRIMVMRELEGLSYGQIGERMGMSTPVVESTLFRARRRLHTEYDELASGRRCQQVQSMIAARDERPMRSLGIRQRGQLARHLAHCQPCRRTARMAGLDESFFRAPGLIGKIAALLPFPWLRLRLRRGARGEETTAARGSRSISVLRPLQAVAQLADRAGPLTGFGRAATAAVAALVVAGAGGGIVAGLDAHHARPLAVPQALPAPGASAGVRHSVASGLRQGQGQSLPGAAAVPGAGSAATTTATATTSAGPGSTGSGTSTGRTPSGSASRLSALTGVAAVVPNAAGKLTGGPSSATGLLGGSTSGLPAPPRPPKVALPTVQTVTDAVKNTAAQLPTAAAPSVPKVPLPSAPKVQLPSVPKVQPPSVPKVQPPSASLPDPSGLIPPLGRH